MTNGVANTYRIYLRAILPDIGLIDLQFWGLSERTPQALHELADKNYLGPRPVELHLLSESDADPRRRLHLVVLESPDGSKTRT